MRLLPTLLVFWLSLPVVAVGDQAGPSAQPQHTQFRDFLTDGQACSHCPMMTTLPPGGFRMGSPLDIGHAGEHAPGDGRFNVTMPGGLSIGLHEVTLAQFRPFAEANPEQVLTTPCRGVIDGQYSDGDGRDWFRPGFPQTDSHPVVCVAWSTAKAYTKWLSRITGQHYRLPSEAEWEYAARATSESDYWWGDALLPDYANCGQILCDERFDYTAPVGSFRANLFGLFDMHGNVWEWTGDCYDAAAYRRAIRPHPLPVKGEAGCRRVIRGGSWTDNFWVLRSSNREGWRPDRPWVDIGFRVVRVGRRVPL